MDSDNFNPVTLHHIDPILLVYCKFTIIRENAIFANIREFDTSQLCVYMEFTLESITQREFIYPQINVQLQK